MHLDLTLDPQMNNCERLVKYKKDGTIYSDRPIIKKDLAEHLNLNEQTLKNHRRECIDLALKNIWVAQNKSGNKSRTWAISIVENEKKKWLQRNKKKLYSPFCQAVAFVLDRKIERLRRR